MDLAAFNLADYTTDEAFAVQRELARRGFYRGEIDGKFGPKSQQALSDARRTDGGESVAPPTPSFTQTTPAPASHDLTDADCAPLSDRSERIIATLAVPFQPLVRALIHRLAANGKRFEALSGYRSYEQQATLHAAYLRGGPVATSPGNSVHNFAMACDLGYFLPDGRYSDDLEGHAITTAELGRVYTLMGQTAESLGLHWGGRFGGRSQDMPHIEYWPAWAAGMSEAAYLDELRRRHTAGIDLLA